MKIELKTIYTKQSYDAWVKQYVRSHKLVAIGCGAFATAYSTSKKKGRTVTKIGSFQIKNFKADAYCSYLTQVVLKHQNNPLVPKILSVTFIKLNTREYDKWVKDTYNAYRSVYIVEMERLKHFRKVCEAKREKHLRALGLSCIDDLDRPIVAARRDKTGHLKEIAPSLHKLFRRHSEDLHDGNVMWRMVGKKLQLVITDPVA